MEQRVKVDLIVIACWILGYLLSAWYLLRVGIKIGTIVLVFSILVPIILVGRSMVLSQIKGYPILKPFINQLADGPRFNLLLKNEGGAQAGGIKAQWIYNKTKSSNYHIKPNFGVEVISPRRPIEWRLPKEFPYPYDKKGESVIVIIKTSDGKKDFCSCRVFVSDGKNWIGDIKRDHNTKPYISKFKPCKDCMFLEDEHETK